MPGTTTLFTEDENRGLVTCSNHTAIEEKAGTLKLGPSNSVSQTWGDVGYLITLCHLFRFIGPLKDYPIFNNGTTHFLNWYVFLNQTNIEI